jgi:arylsulfatase A-like enzyme
MENSKRRHIMKNSKNYLSSMLILLFTVLINGCSTNQEKHPNIVFFLVDDLGYSDVGCYGSDYYQTPNIDKLTEEGMRFTNAYAASCVCSPTRASILSGKYPGRSHITMAIPIKGYARIKGGEGTPLKDADYTMNMPLEEITIAEALKNAGYATASIGKWHVCEDSAYFPEYQGFDMNVGGSGRGHSANYFYPYDGKWRMAEGHPLIEWNTLPDGEPGEYLTDRLTEEGLNFMENNKNRPFFLYLSHYAVHTPIQAKENLISKYSGIEPDSIKGHVHPKYAAMIESVDQSMEAVVKKLEELKLTENTIIVFTSDNGGHGRWTSNYPLRGNKGNFYEGGIRVPLIFKWPGKIASSTISEIPVISTDFYSTLLDMAGLPLKPEQHKDGVSLWPLLKGSPSLERDAIYWHFPNYIGTGHPNPATPCSVIRSGEWKLIERFESGECELYNLQLDLAEKNDLADEMPEKVEELKKMLAKWRKDVNAQMPEVNPDYQQLP